MKLPRILRNVLIFVVVLVLLAGLVAGSTWLYFHPRFERVAGIVYGNRHGRD